MREIAWRLIVSAPGFRRSGRRESRRCDLGGAAFGRILWLLALVLSPVVSGQEPADRPDWWHGDYATGQWGGARERLSQWGVTANLGYTADLIANVAGGLRTGGAYAGLAQFGLDWTPQPWIPGWQGAVFRVSGLYAHQSRSPTLSLVGDVNGLSNIEAPNGLRLYEFWWQQSLWQGRITLQLGNLLADDYFAYTDFGVLFLNSGFGWSQFVAANTHTVVPAFPFAAPGVRLEGHPSRSTYVQAGAYDGDALDNVRGELTGNPHGTRFELHGDQGVFVIGEAGWRLNQEPADSGLPGTYKIGGYYHSGEHEDLYRDRNGDSFVVSGLPPRRHSGSFTLYAAAEQLLWREPGATVNQGLGAFFRLGAGPADRSAYDLVIDGGCHYQGPIPGRDEDALGLGVVYLGVSDDLRRQQIDDRDLNGTPVPALSDYELVFELTYRAQINPWWYLQPDLQWIIHPGASAAIRDAWVIGVRSGWIF